MNTHQKRKLVKRRRIGKAGGGMPFWLIGLLVLGGFGSVCAAVGIGSIFAVYNSYAKDYVPIEDKLHQTNAGLTEIYDRGGPQGGTHLGDLTNPDARLLAPVTLDHISPYLIQATISTEDNSFETNPGVNIAGLIRAGFEYFTGGINSGTGGSSITQQLIKNVYICPSVGADDATTARCALYGADRTVSRKLKEIAYALELEKDYSKDQILQWYLNQISYADRYVGIQAAAQGYFHKDAADLTLAESALLAGVPQAPTDYHPRLNCVRDDKGQCVVVDGQTTVGGKAKQRQEEVLNLMAVHGRATQAQVDAAKAEVVKVYTNSNPLKASAFIDDQVEPVLVRMCNAGKLPRLPQATDCLSSVHSAGWKVTTTLDYGETQKAQQMVGDAISGGLEKGCQCNNASIVTIEPTSGQIIVYVPNRDPTYTSDRKVAGDIDQAVEINQPGSSFKPAVYLNWFDNNTKNPMSTFWDTSPLTVEGTAITDPRADGGNEGLITARAGLGGSQNVPAFRAAQEGGIDNVIAMAKKLGITTLDQHFDPTFYSHQDITYGASIATGGANVRLVDMAYMNATIANMGAMIGVPTYAQTVQLKDMKSTAGKTGADYDAAFAQKQEFQRGNIRIPGTRELDPVVILKVQDVNGNVLYDHATANDLQTKQMVNAGSVWLLQSIMTDCHARFIIWSCGSSNTDLSLDAFMSDGTKIPEGIKTGTQQGPQSAVDTLATWMNGYSRYAATAVWVGNADKSLVKDGPAANYAAANTTTTLFKSWMGAYHDYLQSKGVFKTPEDFSSIQPPNVAQRTITSPTTDRVFSGGGCDQTVTAWVRTDVTYAPECESVEIDSRNGLLASDQTPAQFRVTRKFVKLPAFHPELAIALAHARGIPIAPTEKSTGAAALEITSLSNGKTLTSSTDIVGSVQPPSLKSWKLEIGPGQNPSQWITLGSGSNPVNNGVLGHFDIAVAPDGVYTVRLTTDTGLSTSVTVNVKRSASGGPFGNGTPSASQTPQASRTTTPVGTRTIGTQTPRPTEANNQGNGNGNGNGGGN
jgi:membrane peptidoglycan carboxypeptidase